MKILGLCFLIFSFIFCLTPISQAQESTATKEAPPILGASPATADGIVLDLNASTTAGPEHSCAYMRTYRVKRDRRTSDMTKPAGYTTCVPVKRFEVRSAVREQDGPTVRR